MNTKTMLLIGGGAAVAYYLYSRSSQPTQSQLLAQQQAAQQTALRLAATNQNANASQNNQNAALINAGSSLLQSIINPQPNSQVDMYGQNISPTGMYGINRKNII